MGRIGSKRTGQGEDKEGGRRRARRRLERKRTGEEGRKGWRGAQEKRGRTGRTVMMEGRRGREVSLLGAHVHSGRGSMGESG